MDNDMAHRENFRMVDYRSHRTSEDGNSERIGDNDDKANSHKIIAAADMIITFVVAKEIVTGDKYGAEAQESKYNDPNSETVDFGMDSDQNGYEGGETTPYKVPPTATRSFDKGKDILADVIDQLAPNHHLSHLSNLVRNLEKPNDFIDTK